MTLTHARLLQLLRYEPEAGVFVRLTSAGGRKAGEVAGGVGNHGYVQIGVDGKHYLAQRLAVFYMTGTWPHGDVDHRDTDVLNNRWANLRVATRAQNMMNRKRPPRGCSLHKHSGLWRSELGIDGRRLFLGYFPSADLAEEFYALASEMAHGEFSPFANGEPIRPRKTASRPGQSFGGAQATAPQADASAPLGNPMHAMRTTGSACLRSHQLLRS